MTYQNILSNHHCTPCHKGTPPLTAEQTLRLYTKLNTDWLIIENHHLEKTYHFADFIQALTFTNKVGYIAEQEGHHPNILLSYGKVTIQLYTHKIKGLSENDFILAAKCDKITR